MSIESGVTLRATAISANDVNQVCKGCDSSGNCNPISNIITTSPAIYFPTFTSTQLWFGGSSNNAHAGIKTSIKFSFYTNFDVTDGLQLFLPHFIFHTNEWSKPAATGSSSCASSFEITSAASSTGIVTLKATDGIPSNVACTITIPTGIQLPDSEIGTAEEQFHIGLSPSYLEF